MLKLVVPLYNGNPVTSFHNERINGVMRHACEIYAKVMINKYPWHLIQQNKHLEQYHLYTLKNQEAIYF